MPWNKDEFENACRKFRNAFPDLQTFEQPGERYVYEERAYKDELFSLYDSEVRPLLTDPESDILRSYCNILRRSLVATGEQQNLISWRAIDKVSNLSAEETLQYGRMLRKVIESNGTADSVTAYGDAELQFWQSESISGLRATGADARELVSLLLMLHDPREYMFFKFTYWNDSAKLLIGKPLIKHGSHITGEEFVECQNFARRVFAALKEASFRPKDMIDVQGFLYTLATPTWNQRAFDSSVGHFKQRYEGFSDFTSCGDVYLRSQREFKEEVVARYEASVKPLIESDSVDFLNAYHSLINGDIESQRPGGFEGWRVLTSEVPQGKKVEFASMLQALIRSGSNRESIDQYGKESYQLLEGDELKGDSQHIPEKLRGTATLLRSLHWPGKYAHAIRAVWNAAGMKFRECELIEPGAVVDGRLIKKLDDFAEDVEYALNEANLAPTNKFDIQSFLWSVYDESDFGTMQGSSGVADVDSATYTVHEQFHLAKIVQEIRSQGMRIDEATVRQYHFSMRTRGFIILAGPSGVGKTWLTRLYADVVNAEYRLAPVAPNWSTNEDLLGFFNPIDGEFHATAFLDFIDRSAESWDRLGPDAPEFHLVLDEMNLARVEHYFSLFLSLMEMRREAGVPETRLTGDRVVRIPPNLKFAGTVNMDETTHGFADKVFDRAQLIELSISSDAAREHVNERIGDSPPREVLLDLWERMAPACPVGFRVLDDIADYLELAKQEDVDWRVALDEQIVSKLLPKLRGLDPEVAEALRRVSARVAGEFPRAAAKCQSMLQRVQSTDVVSFF